MAIAAATRHIPCDITTAEDVEEAACPQDYMRACNGCTSHPSRWQPQAQPQCIPCVSHVVVYLDYGTCTVSWSHVYSSTAPMRCVCSTLYGFVLVQYQPNIMRPPPDSACYRYVGHA